MSKVAIVILNWNGRHYLQQFLPAVLQTAFAGVDIIVADNASSDDSVSFLNNHFPQVQVIQLDQNYGFARGYNEALKKVNAEYYVLLNSDVEVTPNWLQPMIALLDSDKVIAACQPKLLAYKNKHLFEYAGAAGGWLDHYGYPFAKGRIFDHCEADNGQYDQQEPIFWASGAALFIRASVYHEMNGFDNYFFAHQEEIDLCWRIQLAGYKIYSCPQSIVYHVGGGTLPHGNSKKTFLNFRNNHIMLFKNLSGFHRWWNTFFRLFLDAVSAWKTLLNGDGGYFIAILRAHLAFAKWVFFHQSKSVFPRRKSAELHGFYKGNVVWQHFVKKKKLFSEIIR